MAAELDVSISSQQAVVGVNELRKVFEQLIDNVKKVDATLATGQQQIDKLGNSFLSSAGEIKASVAEMSGALQRAKTDLDNHGKAQEASISRASRYISKLQDLIKIEQHAVEVNKQYGIASDEGAKKKAVFAAQIQKNVAAMSAEGQQIDLLVRKLMGLQKTNENLAAKEMSADKRQAFTISLTQEADILSRVNARASELGVKVSELSAYKQFLAQATRLNIDLNGQEFASLQKLYLAKEEQIKIGREIGRTQAAPAAGISRTSNISIASTPAALDLELAKTNQLVAIYSQYSGNTAELAIQKEILNRKMAAGNSLSDIEIARIEKRVRAIYQNKEAINQLILEEDRRQKVSGVVGGLSTEGAQLDKLIGVYRRYGANVQELSIQKEILNRVTAAGGNVSAQEYKNIEAGVRASAAKKMELEKLQAQYDKTTAATSRFSGGLTRMQLILSGIVYMGLNRAVSSVADFYTNLSIANAVTEASVGEMVQLEAAARKLGETTVFTAGEAANGIQFLGQAGMDVEKILQTLPDTLNLASAGSIDLGRAADIATNMMASFGLQAGQMGEAADIIAYTAAKSNTNVEQLAEGMKYAGPAAKAAGLDLGETAAIIGTLSNAGLQASMAGTSLRQALIQLSKEPTKNATKALKELGLTFDDVSLKNNTFEQAIGKLASRGMNLGQAAAIFDTRAATAMLALADLIPVWDKLNKGIDGAAGTAERMAKIRLDNLTGDFRLLASATEELILTLGDAGFLRLLRDLTVTSKDTILGVKDWIRTWNEWWDASDKAGESLTSFSQKANDVGLAIGIIGTGLNQFKVGLDDVKTEAEAVEEPIIRLNDLILNIGKALAITTGIRLAVWAVNSATGIGLLATAFFEFAKAQGAASAASLLLKGSIAWLAGPYGLLLVATATGTVVKEWYNVQQEIKGANEQVATMNRQLEDMAMYSKRAAAELVKATAEQYKDLFEGLSVKPTAKITVDDPRPKQLLEDWRKINELIEEYRSYGSFLPPEQARELSRLELAQQSIGQMMSKLAFASASLNSQFDISKNRIDGISEAVKQATAIATGWSAAIFQTGKPKMPGDETGGGEDRGKAFANFVKNLERANKEQKELNRLRKEYGDNEDLINLKLKIYNTLLEAKDIKGGISSAESKRIENLVTETAKQENLNKSLKAFIDLQKETEKTSAMAGYARTYGTDSMQYSVAKQMKDFLKNNTNLSSDEIMRAKEMFIKQFYDDRTIRETKKGEKDSDKEAKKAEESYKKYLADVERDILVTTEKIKLAEQYGRNQDLLNVKIKDYEQRLRIEADLLERGIALDSDRGKALVEQIRLRDEIKEKYDAEIERVKKVIEVNKELANTFVGAIKEAKNFRDAFIRLGDAAQEMVLKMLANKASESLFGMLMGGFGKAKAFSTTIGPNDVAVNGTGGAFMRGSKVQAFGTGGVFTGPTIFPMANGQVGLAGERGNEVFMPAKRMMNGDVGVRVQVPTTGRGASGVVMSNQFNIKVEGGTREQNDDAAEKVSKSVEMAMRNIAYDVMMKEKSTGGMLRR